jgi:hypothetical protein
MARDPSADSKTQFTLMTCCTITDLDHAPSFGLHTRAVVSSEQDATIDPQSLMSTHKDGDRGFGVAGSFNSRPYNSGSDFKLESKGMLT